MSDTLLGSPTPALFSAQTLNWYFEFTTRSVTTKLVSFTGSELTFLHCVLVVSLHSTVYPRIGLPPSDSGGVHFTVISVESILETIGIAGEFGGSEIKIK